MAKVLIVDDDAPVARALSRLLKRSGFEVAQAGSGAEALTLLETFAADIVLSDYRMPAMNGAELLEIVRERYPAALRIIISGYAEPGRIDPGLVCRVLSKPWNDGELAQLLQQLLRERNQRS